MQKAGVIIGRFQTPDLHEGHTNLIDSVIKNHSKVLILLGSTPGVLVTRNNPLDFITRKVMIQEKYPDIIVMPLHDMPNDFDWSISVDRRIQEALGDHIDVILYGSRDSFIPHYHGKHDVKELDSSVKLSATQVREAASQEVRQHSEFRRGVIYAAFNQHPSVYPTIDVAIIVHNKEIILGRKNTDPAGFWRFPGGFLDPQKDNSLEFAVCREVSEEVGCEISSPRYIGSTEIDDWRYKKEINKVITSVFIADYLFGPIKPGDDLHELKKFNLENFNLQNLLPQHRPIMELVLAYLKKE